MQLGQEMGDPSPPKDGRDYPHLDDLVARANPKVDIHVPVRRPTKGRKLWANTIQARSTAN